MKVAMLMMVIMGAMTMVAMVMIIMIVMMMVRQQLRTVINVFLRFVFVLERLVCWKTVPGVQEAAPRHSQQRAPWLTLAAGPPGAGRDTIAAGAAVASLHPAICLWVTLALGLRPHKDSPWVFLARREFTCNTHTHTQAQQILQVRLLIVRTHKKIIQIQKAFLSVHGENFLNL